VGNRFPIYDLLHQEIKACANHLLEVCNNQRLSVETDGQHILSRLKELHDFSQRFRTGNHYHPLFDLKDYLENTMLPFIDEKKRWQSMRLSEAVSLLAQPPLQLGYLDATIVTSLFNHCIHHFKDEIQPGRRLYKTLKEINSI
jgi:hypothetical protein